MEDRLLTMAEVAQATAHPLGTWRKWVATGKSPLPVIRIGRTVRFLWCQGYRICLNHRSRKCFWFIMRPFLW